MKIIVNIEGEDHTFTDETPIKEITGLFNYFTEEVYGGDVDIFSLAKAILLHNKISFEDLENVFSYLYTREPDEYFSKIIPDLVIIGEKSFEKIKKNLSEDDLVTIAKNDGIGNLLKDAKQYALATLLDKGVNSSYLENLILLYPNIPVDIILYKFQEKKLDEYDFSRFAISKLYHLCISYHKKSVDVANKLFEILKNTKTFKAQTESYSDFELVQKSIDRSFGFPEFRPAIMGRENSTGEIVEYTS